MKGLAGSIVDGIKSLLETLFVPDKGFFEGKINKIKTALAGKFGMSTYEELFKALKAYTEGKLDFGGYIDLSLWKPKLPTVKNFIRGFFYPLIILGDVRLIIWLIRGSAPYASSEGRGGAPA